MHQPIDRQPIDGQPMDQIRQNRQLQPSQYGATAPQWREWDDEDTIDLREYWQMLVRRRLTVLSILVLAFVGGLLVTFLTTPIFRATLLLQIEPEPSKVLSYENIVPIDSENDFYKTQYQLLHSRTLVRRVIEQLNLVDSRNFLTPSEQPSSFTSIKESLMELITGNNKSLVREEPVSEGMIRRSLTIQPVRGSRLVKIHYDGPNPEQAARITNAVAENYINTTLERRVGASSYAKTFLDERIRHVRDNLEDAERELVAYAREREIVSLDNKMATLTEHLRETSNQLFATETMRIEAETMHDAMHVDPDSTGAYEWFSDDSTIQSLETRKQELQAEYDENLKRLKPGYPSMEKLQEQIDDIEQKLSDAFQAILASAGKSAVAYAKQEAKLRARVADIKEKVLSLQDQNTDYQTLKRDVSANRQLYEVLLQRMKEVDLIAGISTNNIAVIDKAEVPRYPYKPNLSRNLKIALMLGLFGGCLIAFVFEKFDDTLKTGEELEKHLGLPLLGVTPDISREEALGEEEIALLTYRVPNSILAEAYRSIRTGLFFSTHDGTPKILHFTSSGPVEGKTTSAIGVATAFVQAGNVVLLIDGDMRNPSLHRLFGLTHNQPGLSSYLTGDRKPYEVTYSTEIEKVFVIPAGPSPANPVELLSGSKMLELLNIALDRFDYIIIDSPPVVGLADALVLSNLAHATVFIAASGNLRRSIVDGSIKRLRSARATLVGTILTRMDRETRYGYYSYSYNYDYSYGTKTPRALDNPSV